MASQADVRRIALALPGTQLKPDRFAFEVECKGKLKGYAWVWMERVEPKKPRVPNPGVLAVRVANLAQKDMILAAEPAKYFTEPHYNGYPAVLVRLGEVTVADLRPLLQEAWACMVPAAASRARAPAARKKPTAKAKSARKASTRKKA